MPTVSGPAGPSDYCILAVMEQPRRMAADLVLPDAGDSACGLGRHHAQRLGGPATAGG